MEIGKIYFWTATINRWQKLLWPDRYKKIILNSLTYLSKGGKIDIFSFVIMPNHLHLIWRPMQLNGKETAQASFLKYTAHEFRKKLDREDKKRLQSFRVESGNKKHEFWQRDPLAIHPYTRKVAFQKLDYIHRNPLSGRWHLVDDPCDYKYSSARYYQLGIRDFSFLKDLREEF